MSLVDNFQQQHHETAEKGETDFIFRLVEGFMLLYFVILGLELANHEPLSW